MIWSLFLLLLIFPNYSFAGTCPSSYLPVTSSECPETADGCNISQASCSPNEGCKTRMVHGTAKPGGLQSFCIDPGKDVNFLKVQTKVDEGCGSARTLVNSPGGWRLGSDTGTVVLNADSNTITPPITVTVIGEVRPEDFTIEYTPSGGGGGGITGPTCDPPATSSGN